MYLSQIASNSKTMQLLVLFLLITARTFATKLPVSNKNEQKEFINVAEFKTLRYGFPCPADEKQAIESGFHNASIITRPYGFAMFKELLFLTIPRLGEPVPYSLAVVTNKQTEKGPELRPFPNYEVHKVNDKVSCDKKIVSVFRPNVSNKDKHHFWVNKETFSDG